MYYCTLFVFLLGVLRTDLQTISGTIDRLIGIGYDVIAADPDSEALAGADPGFKRSRRVFDISINGSIVQVPTNTCTTATNTYIVYDEKSLQKSYDKLVSFSGEVNSTIFNARYGKSAGYSAVQEQTNQERNVYFQTDKICNYGNGSLRYSLPDMKFSNDYQYDVCSLPTIYDENKYLQFLSTWGTHVVILVTVGTRSRNRTTVKLNSFMQYVSDMENKGIVTGGSVSVLRINFGSELKIDMSTLRAKKEFYEKIRGITEVRAIGSKMLPEPINVEVVSIVRFLDNNRYFSSSASCITNNQSSGLAAISKNIIRALDEYPTNLRVRLSSSTGFIKMPLNLPLGTYGMYRVENNECPVNQRFWKTGWRIWDCKDVGNANSISAPLYVAGRYGRNIKQYFCIKDQDRLSKYDLKWPLGVYCILKKGDCPEGFFAGNVVWDDENYKNINEYGGYLPDGVYNKDTQIYFCCRKDGDITRPIFLPVNTPLVLVQADSRGCQKVSGMVDRQQWVYWHTASVSAVNQTLPYVDKSVRLYFCVYGI